MIFKLNLKVILTALIAALLASACAKIVSPTGGEEDEIAPKVSSYSRNFPATNFNDDKIILEFDEFIQLSDPTKIKFSPRTDIAPEYKVRGKKLIVELPESLNKDLTYSIDFGDAIKDYTENNAANNLRLAFTAKEKLDTAYVKGLVRNAFDHKLPKEIIAGLYAIEDEIDTDSLIFKKKPLYVSNVNETTGRFLFSSVAPNDYLMIAFKDENKDEYYEANEALAFYSETINVTDSSQIENLKLYLFENKEKNQEVASEEYVSRETYKVRFNNFIEALDYNILQKNEGDKLWMSELKDIDSLVIYHQIKDSIEIELLNVENNISSVIDTIWIKKDTSLYEQNILPKENFQEKISLPFFESYQLEMLIPIKEISEDRIRFEQLIDSNYIEKERMFNIENGKMKFDGLWNGGELYKVSIYDEGLIGINNTKSIDTIVQEVQVQGPEKYGSALIIVGDSIVNEGSFVYEFRIEKSNKLIEKNKLTGNLKFENLKAEKYSLILIDDTNENGKWDKGNWFAKKQPEKTYLFKGIEIKSNWDTSVNLEW